MLKRKSKWTIWKYALGSFNDEKTERYDDIICLIRTVILLTYVVTNVVICAGVIRHWDKGETVTTDTVYVKK